MTKVLLSAAFVVILSLSAAQAHSGGGVAVVNAINPFACAPGDFSAGVSTVRVDAMHPQGMVR